MESAACWSLAVARMATPVRVSLKIRVKMMVPMAANIKPQRRPDGTMAKPRSRGSGGKISGNERYSGDQMTWVSPCRMLESPIVTITTEMMGCPIIGRRMILSRTIPITMAKPRVHKKATQNGAPNWPRTVRQI